MQTKIPRIKYPKKPASKKTATKNIIKEIIFNLGSKLCMYEEIGIYLPNVMLSM